MTNTNTELGNQDAPRCERCGWEADGIVPCGPVERMTWGHEGERVLVVCFHCDGGRADFTLMTDVELANLEIIS